MSAASEKAADRMHADLEAMFNSARMHCGLAKTTAEFEAWRVAYHSIEAAMRDVSKCMSERDRKLASR